MNLASFSKMYVVGGGGVQTRPKKNWKAIKQKQINIPKIIKFLIRGSGRKG